MGTNYYLKAPGDVLLHIGKSSSGWCFSLRVYPVLGIKTLNDWKFIFCDPYALIEDEYGRFLTPSEMLNVINNRSWAPALDLYAYAVYTKNHTEPGPNGLLRCKVDGDHCIGHGEGPWDYIVEDFS